MLTTIVQAVVLAAALAAAGSNTFEITRAPRDFDLTADPAAAEWKDAPRVVIDKNNMAEPLPGRPTEVRARWTAGNLYLLYSCPYDELNLKPDPQTTADTPQLWNWDVAEAFIGSEFDHRGHYKEFQVSPQGEWIDLDIDRDHKDREEGAAWNSGYSVKARIDRDAKIWYGEMRIPFRALGVAAPKAGLELRAGLYRISGKDPRTLHAWQPTRQATFHIPDAFGILRLK
jgi:hypothetical protein